jgi:hypothetical protein
LGSKSLTVALNLNDSKSELRVAHNLLDEGNIYLKAVDIGFYFILWKGEYWVP